MHVAHSALLETGELPLPQRLALAYAAGDGRAPLHALLALDNHLSRLVAQASEPLLAQMRLAWWREELAKPVIERPTGNAVLDALGEHWVGGESVLQEMVSGWEYLLVEPPLTEAAALAFANGRGHAFAGLAGLLGEQEAVGPAGEAARRWALVDLWGRLSDAGERALLRDLARQTVDSERSQSLPRSLRPLAILDGLARRAARRGDPELLGSRRAMLTVLRLGMFGR